MPDVQYEVAVWVRNGKVYTTQPITCQVPFDKTRQEIVDALSDFVTGEFAQAARGGNLFQMGSNVTESSGYAHPGKLAVNPNEVVTVTVEVTDWCGYPDRETPPTQ